VQLKYTAKGIYNVEHKNNRHKTEYRSLIRNSAWLVNLGHPQKEAAEQND